MIPGFITKYHGSVSPSAPAGGLILSLETPITGLSDGDLVSTWPDDSSFHDNFTQPLGDTRKPTYKSASETINGVPTVKFNTTAPAKYLINASAQPQFTGLTGTNGATIYIVGKVDSDPPAVGYALYQVCERDAAHFFIANRIPTSTGVIEDASFTTAYKAIGNPTPSLASPFSYACFSKTNLFTARLNGSQIFTTATNTFLATASAGGDPTFIYIGKDVGTGSNSWISLFKIWDHVLDATEIAQMDAYIYAKFGI